MSFPEPTNYGEWRSWATRLLEVMNRAVEVVPLQLPTFSSTTSPRPNKDGLVILLDGDLRFSRDREWQFNFALLGRIATAGDDVVAHEGNVVWVN